jgi:SAM-dependent methyltransferase
MPRAFAAAFLLLVAAAAGQAQPAGQPQPRSREECEAAYPASWGRAGKDVVWVPTLDGVVLAMLSMAQVAPGDLVLDLGAGDGKIAIAAARSFDARAVGIEYDPGLARRAECLVRVEGLADRVRIVQGDIFKEDFGAASVVTLYLLPHLNLCVRHRLLAMAPGTRVVSHQYGMAEWPADQSVNILGRDVHLWIVPARVDGIWDFRDSQGTTFAVDLRQTFGALSGQIEQGGGVREALVSPTLRGVELRFAFGAGGEAVKFSGTVRGNEITGVLSTGSSARTAVGRPRGALRGATWAEMQPDCRRYYER